MINALNLGDVKLPGDFPNVHQFNIPVTQGLTALFLLGESPKRSPRNLAGNGAPAAKVVGAPVFNGVSGAFDANNYITLGKNLETVEMTLLAILRNTEYATSNAGYFGTNGGDSAPLGDAGVCLLEQATGNPMSITGSVWRLPGTGSIGTVSADNANFQVAALRTSGSPTGLGFTQNYTTGSYAEHQASGSRSANPNNEYTIGRLSKANLRGKCELMAAIGYDRSLDDSEMASMYAWLKSYAASKGVDV